MYVLDTITLETMSNIRFEDIVTKKAHNTPPHYEKCIHQILDSYFI